MKMKINNNSAADASWIYAIVPAHRVRAGRDKEARPHHRLSQHVLRPHGLAIRGGDGLAASKLAEVRADLDAELDRPRLVELPCAVEALRV